MPFLATTASITPFIGLFGTVVGHHDCVLEHRLAGLDRSGGRRTGHRRGADRDRAGLVAAIPAVYFYNHFTTKVKTYASEMDDFALEFLNIAERNFT